MVLVGFLLIFFGLMNFLFPEVALKMEDWTRIRGDRDYTPFAKGMTRLSGVVLIVAGILLIVSPGVFGF